MSKNVEIVRLGSGGDGATTDGTFVPHTVPGDIVRLGSGANPRVEEIIEAGPWRQAATCRHFGVCGGCSLQHVNQVAYLGWKRELIVSALARRGFENIEIEDVRAVMPGSRRRASFKARRTASGVMLGFYEPQSRNLVDAKECPILISALAEALPRMRRGVEKLLVPGETAELYTTHTDAGLDISLRWKKTGGSDVHFALAEFAQELGLARLSWNGEVVAVASAPHMRVGGHTIFLPIEPFLQPTREGEAILQSLVQLGVSGAVEVADLFAGCGTFSLALAEGCSVSAVEKNSAMISALEDAARDGNSKIAVERRDLFSRPLLPSELAKFDAVILDPPRPGAQRQAGQLAKSGVSRIVYVSCNPTSFARDARILSDGGYRLRRVVPVDQFLWSAHIELVAFLDRDMKS